MNRLLIGAALALLVTVPAWAHEDGSHMSLPLANLIQTIDAHSAAVNSIAFSSDGLLIYSGGKDGRLKVWDATTLELLRWAPVCQVAINDVALSDDGLYVATAAEDGYVKVWDAQTLDLVVALAAHVGQPDSSGLVSRYNKDIRSSSGTAPRYATERVSSVLSANTVAISPDNFFIYTGGDDGAIRCWSVEEQYTLLWEATGLYGHVGGVNDLTLSGGGTVLWSGGVDGMVKIYGAQTGEFFGEIQAAEKGEVVSISLNHLETCVGTGLSNGELRIWDSSTGSLVKKIRAHAGSVNQVGFTSDDMLALTVGDDGMVKLWNHDAELAAEEQAHVLASTSMALVGSTLVTAGADFKVRVWSANFIP